MTATLAPAFAATDFAATDFAAVALPSAAPFPTLPAQAIPAIGRRSLLSVVRHRASLLYALAMLASSAGYCVYALGHMAG